MITMLAGFAIAAALWWALKAYGQADPRLLARLAKRVGGAVALALAAVLLVRGRFDMAALAGGVGLWLLGWADAPALVQRFAGLRGRRPHQDSPARSRFVELWRRPDGSLGGRVIDGPWSGRDLDALDAAALGALARDCADHDPEGARLLEAYLHGRASRRGEDAEARDHAGGRRDPQRGAMSEEEAYQVLGVQPGASPDAIRSAHRALMKKLHPDQGGTTYLASRINQARDALLDRHR